MLQCCSSENHDWNLMDSHTAAEFWTEKPAIYYTYVDRHPLYQVV